jgi:hypothetical protein
MKDVWARAYDFCVIFRLVFICASEVRSIHLRPWTHKSGVISAHYVDLSIIHQLSTEWRQGKKNEEEREAKEKEAKKIIRWKGMRKCARGLFIALMIEAANTSETSVNFYETTRCATTQKTVIFNVYIIFQLTMHNHRLKARDSSSDRRNWLSINFQ